MTRPHSTEHAWNADGDQIMAYILHLDYREHPSDTPDYVISVQKPGEDTWTEWTTLFSRQAAENRLAFLRKEWPDAQAKLEHKPSA